MVLPAHLLPAGIGTLAANATGIFVEAADSEDEGRWVTWEDIAHFALHWKAKTMNIPEPLPFAVGVPDGLPGDPDFACVFDVPGTHGRQQMIMVGVTPPMYPPRSGYRKRCLGKDGWQDEAGPYYVLDCGRFWESPAWRAFYREHGETPAEAMARDKV
jgi:hypothetical protein